jgi:hypothetical protein
MMIIFFDYIVLQEKYPTEGNFHGAIAKAGAARSARMVLGNERFTQQ